MCTGSPDPISLLDGRCCSLRCLRWYGCSLHADWQTLHLFFVLFVFTYVCSTLLSVLGYRERRYINWIWNTTGSLQVLCLGSNNNKWFLFFFMPKWSFLTAWTYPKTHWTWNISHTWRKMLQSIVVLNFHHKCILAINSHIHCRTLKNLTSTHSLNCSESCGIGHAHFRLPLFFRYIAKCWKPTFSNSSQAISSICTKLGTQHLWMLLSKNYQKTFNSTINFFYN